VRAFSFGRLGAIVAKEFTQIRRDRLTFAMIVGIPLMQLLLFGFARPPGEAAARRLVETGAVNFVVTIPEDFSTALQRGERPAVLVEADASDPAATSNAVSTLRQMAATVLNRELTGPLEGLRARPGPFELIIHNRYNPEGITQYNIVPGLMGVILTMTMVLMTALAVTRERERGTMEALLSMPVRPIELMVGKIVPYIFIGYLQVGLIIAAAAGLFGVPIRGSSASGEPSSSMRRHQFPSSSRRSAVACSAALSPPLANSSSFAPARTRFALVSITHHKPGSSSSMNSPLCTRPVSRRA